MDLNNTELTPKVSSTPPKDHTSTSSTTDWPMPTTTRSITWKELENLKKDTRVHIEVIPSPKGQRELPRVLWDLQLPKPCLWDSKTLISNNRLLEPQRKLSKDHRDPRQAIWIWLKQEPERLMPNTSITWPLNCQSLQKNNSSQSCLQLTSALKLTTPIFTLKRRKSTPHSSPTKSKLKLQLR